MNKKQFGVALVLVSILGSVIGTALGIGTAKFVQTFVK